MTHPTNDKNFSYMNIDILLDCGCRLKQSMHVQGSETILSVPKVMKHMCETLTYWATTRATHHKCPK